MEQENNCGKQQPGREQLELLFSKDVIEFSKPIIEQYSKLMAYYRCAIMEIETKFNVLNQEFSLRYDRNPISSIKSRLKNPNSIREKLARKNIPITIPAVEENLSDVAGVRVICSFTDDVYMLASALIKQDDIELISVKDYIKNPKPSGYSSYHLIALVPVSFSKGMTNVKVEIKIRTIAMDFWASLEHKIKYKYDEKLPKNISKELIECSKIVNKLDKKMSSLGNNLIEEFDLEQSEKNKKQIIRLPEQKRILI